MVIVKADNNSKNQLLAKSLSNKDNTVFLLTFQGLGMSSFGVLSLAKAIKRSGGKVLVFGSELDIFDFWAHNRIEFLYKLLEYKPKIVGLSVMSTFADMINEVSSFIKHYCPETKVFVGGIHALVAREDILLNNPSVDYVFVGDGEEQFVECVKLINKGEDCDSVTGIAYRSSEGIVFNGFPTPTSPIEIDFLDILDDFASFSIMKNIEKYMTGGAYSLLLSRGCPYQCSFCAIPNNPYMRKVRYSDPERVDAFLKKLKGEGVRLIYIHDAEFNLNREWALKIIDIVLKHGIQISFTYLRINLLTRVFLEKIKPAVKAGILKLSIESGSERIRNGIMNKQVTDKQIYEAFKHAQELGIRVETNYIAGCPEENLEDLIKTKEMHLKLPPMRAVVHVFSVLPGTVLFEKYKPKFDNWHEFDIGNPDLLLGTHSPSKRLSFHNIEPNEFLFRVKELRDIVSSLGYYFRVNYDLKDKNVCFLTHVESSAVSTLLNIVNVLNPKNVMLIGSCMPDNNINYKNVDMYNYDFNGKNIPNEIRKKEEIDYLFVVTSSLNPRKDIRQVAALLKSKKRVFLELDMVESDFPYLTDKRLHNIYGINFHLVSSYTKFISMAKIIYFGLLPYLPATLKKIVHSIIRRKRNYS